jgi:hypothetical protein
MSSLDQMLSTAGNKIAHMSDEFKKRHEKMPFEDFKTMTKELKKTKQNLSMVIGRGEVPKFDNKLLSSIMSYINKIKKTAPLEIKIGIRRTPEAIFLDELGELQSVLKTLKSSNKAGSKLIGSSVVKIKGIKSKGSTHADKDLNKHLSLTESKLNALKKTASRKKTPIDPAQFKEVTTILKKANLSLVKTKAMRQSLSGQYKPDYDKSVMRKILKEINFFQDLIDEEVRVGTAHMQVNLFWFTLKEFHTLLQDLESLKKIRGKTVASVQTDMAG